MGTKQLIELPNTDNGCWQWLGRLDPKYGYGIKDVGSSQAIAYNWVHQLFIGSIPHGFKLQNTCGNKTCVRPDHYHMIEKPKIGRVFSDKEKQAIKDFYFYGVDRVIEECPSLKDKERDQIVSKACRMGVNMDKNLRSAITAKAAAKRLLENGYLPIEPGGEDERLIIENWPTIGMKVRELSDMDKYTPEQIRGRARKLGLNIYRKPKPLKVKVWPKKVLSFDERVAKKKTGRKVAKEPVTPLAKTAGNQWGFVV